MDFSTYTTSTQHEHSYPSVPSWPSTSSSSATTTAATTTASNASSAPKSTSNSTAASSTTANSTASYAQTLDGSSEVASAPSSTAAAQYSSQIDLIPYYWLPQHQNYYSQLLHYNKLVSPSRGGGLQATPLPPVVSASNAQAGRRSRSSSKVSLKDGSSGKGTSGGGHGNRSHHNTDKNRSALASKETSSGKMAPKQGQAQAQTQTQTQGTEQAKGPANRSSAAASASSQSQSQGHPQSSSVPSTPHQRARQFSFESRDPSPNDAAGNHSPRSAYSETNSTLPSLRPLPPRTGGCKYETSQINSRRRMPYSLGNERLEKMPLGKIKGKLTEEEERKVATDMREVYDRLLPSDKVEEKRKKLVRKLEKIFNEEWPGHDMKVQLFGSSGNLLCSDDSDVDICIKTQWTELEGVCMIADLLARRGMEKVVCISAAKVPIVKIWDPELGLACDMNVNNTLALENTRMIRVYVEIDPRVRQLMMIIKYWTRRRIVNDAAFGGTFSSYTWICLIIAFLQLRTPPVLPSLHQLPYKTQKPDGTHSDFADNLKKLRGFGSKNKSSEADLLFQFFRFYAHEFDYDKYVLSVRLGKMIPKTDKNWQFALNNQLCVEEPFNNGRNLANTADEYSFKGLHMELRRAFDLIKEAKFEEACEPYVFPKEEERVWTRPPTQSRPVLLRSASQTHNGSGRGGRGGHRNGRHNHRGGGGSNRRASSSVPTYDNTNMFAPTINLQQDLSWYNTHFAMQYPQDFLAQLAYHQQENYRMQMYAQSPIFGQQQQQQGMAQPMMASNSATGQAQSSDRSRTNSFDNQPAMNAAMRPDMFAQYAMAMNSPLFAQAGAAYGTYPASPASTTAAGHDFRRPLQRSSVGNEKVGPASSSSLRSQSQPATRSPSTAQPAIVPGQPLPISQSATNVPNANSRNPNGIPIPSFISDDTDYDETPKASSMSPQSEEGKYAAYFSESTTNTRMAQPSQGPATNIAFGDLANQPSGSSSGRRRLSTDQLPQTILDRRMKRTSRSPSPSPLGHSRTASADTSAAPTPAAPTAGTSVKNHDSRPLVVNGSGHKGAAATSSRHAASAEPRQFAKNVPYSTEPMNPSQFAAFQQPQFMDPTIPAMIDYSHMGVNGSYNGSGTGAEEQSFRDRVAMMGSHYLRPPDLTQNTSFVPNGRLTARHHPQNAVIAPLDLAISNHVRKPAEPDPTLLSPVYENHTPSPTVSRRPDAASKGKAGGPVDSKPSAWSGAVKQNLKTDDSAHPTQDAFKQVKSAKTSAQPAHLNGARENGHVRGARSESDNAWQKAGKGKKKAASTAPQGHAEPPPKNTSERKGG